MGNDNNNPIYDAGMSSDDRKFEQIMYRAMTRAMQNSGMSGSRTSNPSPDSMPNKGSQSFFRDKKEEMEYSSRNSKRPANNPYRSDYRRTGSIIGDIEQGIADGLLDVIAGGDFKKGINAALKTFSDEMGFELRDLPHEIGKDMAKQFMSSDTGKKIGSEITKHAGNLLSTIFDSKGADGKAAKDLLTKMMNNVFGGGGDAAKAAGDAAKMADEASKVAKGAEQAASSMSNVAGEMTAGGSELAAGAASSGSALSALSAAAIELLPILAALLLAVYEFGPAVTGTVELISAAFKSFNRQEEIRKKKTEAATKRMQEDLEYIARQPFEILMEAVKKWESEWDANLAKISLTQGYTKENVYDLYESISSRLISEGFGSVIAATDVIDNLSTILDSGLSGKVAEEFAYVATKLSAAIPTENFTGYASTYAQLASEAMSRGMTQTEAIEYANEQLEQFASNLLYSSRNLAGGFTTGLKDASSLFKDAVDIAQTSKTGDASLISGTLTSISAIIGAVAPDLATGLVQNVVQAAIGGNSDSIVALRSLAGINASNTAFLNALATDPQGLFVTIFQNLANMQNMSPANYMEVAEGLSSVFGVDMKAFARVDFSSLADRISDMVISTDALDENMYLLKEGEATMSTEQLKLQEINNTILDEGLAYIIDSDAGRMIQQHMWDEQIAMQMAETEYAVSIQGAALSFLEGIQETIHNILVFLNPAGYLMQGIDNIIAATEETKAARQDIADILQMTAVGGNQTALDNLLTVGKDLELVSPLIEMMGGSSNYSHNSDWVKYGSAIGGLLRPNSINLGGGIITLATGQNYSGVSGYYANGGGDLGFGLKLFNIGNPGAKANSSNSTILSRYSGFNAGKSSIWSPSGSSKSLPAIAASYVSNAAQNAIDESNKKFQEYLNSAAQASKTMTWGQYKSSISKYGLADFDTALQNYGISEEQLRGYFEANQAREGAIQEQARKEDEQKFRDENRRFWDYEGGTSGIYQTAMWLPFLNDNFKPFFDEGARFDTRMDSIDHALSVIQYNQEIISGKIGDDSKFTVISVLTSINDNIFTTFVNSRSAFQQCLADWVRYIADTKAYKNEISGASAWSELKQAESDMQNETLLALANAMNVFSEDELKKMDPQMQANALLGKIVIILEAMMQQQNTQAGGLSLIDTMSALGLGITRPST